MRDAAAKFATGRLPDMARGDDPRTPGNRATHEPPSGLRTDLAVLAEPANRFGHGKSRRVPAGGMAESVGVTWERVDAEDGDLRACPSVDRPATPRLLEQSRDG